MSPITDARSRGVRWLDQMKPLASRAYESMSGKVQGIECVALLGGELLEKPKAPRSISRWPIASRRPDRARASGPSPRPLSGTASRKMRPVASSLASREPTATPRKRRRPSAPIDLWTGGAHPCHIRSVSTWSRSPGNRSIRTCTGPGPSSYGSLRSRSHCSRPAQWIRAINGSDGTSSSAREVLVRAPAVDLEAARGRSEADLGDVFPVWIDGSRRGEQPDVRLDGYVPLRERDMHAGRESPGNAPP